MEWILDPTAWVGLFTLIVLEIVLGIDNLVFIAILAEKLPQQLRDKARIVGLSFALIMRFFLLISISYLTSLTKPFLTFHSFSFNGRELIMLAGGLFLLYKATVELNERLEGQDEIVHKGKKIARFWPVVAQIVVLDAVFSLDSVITAIGMVHHLEIMILAVTIAIGIMMWASKPLTRFINAHVTLIILCLSFLLMIGFSLVAEGFGYEIPKGYLYAAIGFSILIEFFNQMSRFNRRRFISSSRPLRQRTAEVVLRILEGSHEEEMMDHHSANLIADNQGNQTFNQQEKNMIVRIFGLSQRNVGSIMTSRHDITPLDLSSSTTKISQIIQQNQHNRLVIIDSAISDELLGIIHVNDIAKESLNHRLKDLRSLVKQPLIFPLKASLLTALEQFRKAQTHFAFVADEFGSVEGVVSLTDVMETIAGNLPIEGEELDPRYDIIPDDEGGWVANGYIPLEDLANFIPIPIEDKRDYHTLAGLLQEHTQRLPQEGEKIKLDNLLFSILEVENHRLVKVHITQLD